MINFISCFSYSQVIAEEVSDDIKEALIEGHLGSCFPTIKSQLEKGYPKSKIESYCLCLGKAYFNEFSLEDYEYLTKYSKLPPTIDKKRNILQIKCMHKYLD